MHSMPYIKNSGRFSLGWRKANPEYTFKLSVDTENDLKRTAASGRRQYYIEKLVFLGNYGSDERLFGMGLAR